MTGIGLRLLSEIRQMIRQMNDVNSGVTTSSGKFEGPLLYIVICKLAGRVKTQLTSSLYRAMISSNDVPSDDHGVVRLP